jgi:antitoxin HigA-1
MIRSFRHAGLKRFYERGDRRRLLAEHVPKIARVLAQLDIATDPVDMDLPGFHLHPLTGNLAGFGASRFAPIGRLFSASMTMATQPTLIMWIITDGDVTMPMHNPPHPGLTVRHDCLEPLGLTVTEGAKVLGVTRQALNNLVNGKAGISPEMAVRLSKAFGATPETWLRLQMAYDLSQVRHQNINVKRVARRAVTEDLHP